MALLPKRGAVHKPENPLTVSEEKKMWSNWKSVIGLVVLIGAAVLVYSLSRPDERAEAPNPVVARAETAAPMDTQAPTVTSIPTDAPAPTDTEEPTEPSEPTDTPGPTEALAAPDPRALDIITLLPKDAIPAIFDPQFLSAAEADEWYDPDELVLGVEIDGDARAYSIPLLSNREIVNDSISGRKIAVTW
jgi:hypothetical protein